MKRYTFTFWLLFNFISIIAQNIPSPIRYYPLGYGSTTELIHQKNGKVFGITRPCKDRFYSDDGATEFEPGSYISIPSFFEGSSYKNGFTVTFWLNIVDNENRLKDSIIPWTPTDYPYTAFEASLNNNILLGFSRRRDRAIINRYVTMPDNTFREWELWLWDPTNFTERKGWYFIALTFDLSRMTTYIVYPDGTFTSNMHYLQMQKIPNDAEWTIGSKINYSAKQLNTLKVYDSVLSYEQIRELYSREALPNGIYNVSNSYNQQLKLEVQDYRIETNTKVLLDKTNKNVMFNKWVFEPIEDEPWVYKIRLAYTDKYLTPLNHELSVGNKVVVDYYDYDPYKYKSYLWVVTPSHVIPGTFYIQSRVNTAYYLHVADAKFESGSFVDLYPLSTQPGEAYMWFLNLYKTQSEVNENLYNKPGYEITLDYSPIEGIYPCEPAGKDYIKVDLSTGEWLSLLTFYKPTKIIDDAYNLGNVPQFKYLLHAYNENTQARSSGVNLALKDYKNNPFYLWTIEKYSPFGRTRKLKNVIFETPLQPYVDSQIGVEPKTDFYVGENLPNDLPKNDVFRFYEDGNKAPAAILITQLMPGVYKIRPKESRKYLAPNQKDIQQTSLKLLDFDEKKATAFYWVVDYDRDIYNKPIKNGVMNIKLYGTDHYLFFREHVFGLSPKKEEMSKEVFLWYINIDKYVKKTFNLFNVQHWDLAWYYENNTPILAYYYDATSEMLPYFSWVFEKVM